MCWLIFQMTIWNSCNEFRWIFAVSKFEFGKIFGTTNGKIFMQKNSYAHYRKICESNWSHARMSVEFQASALCTIDTSIVKSVDNIYEWLPCVRKLHTRHEALIDLHALSGPGQWHPRLRGSRNSIVQQLYPLSLDIGFWLGNSDWHIYGLSRVLRIVCCTITIYIDSIFGLQKNYSYSGPIYYFGSWIKLPTIFVTHDFSIVITSGHHSCL